MFVLELTYIAPIDRVEAAHAEHLAWLDAHYASGVFLASGRKVPRDGGVILAVGDDRAKIEEITRSDPFMVAGVCEYSVTEFVPTKTAPALEAYREQRPPA
ncbi:YciI family protein [Streptomyces sp. I05A-00742]|uniref:YciI family protein n=1 Tax=Streptomyces sp. I05A-00742 TaxID=2732853 RepID=UPI001488FE67|nr:YciI family protein [Streptomyces sp. I05A-00742]